MKKMKEINEGEGEYIIKVKKHKTSQYGSAGIVLDELNKKP